MSLLERFAQGDPEAFKDLFRQYQAAVYAWIVRIVRDRGIAEDLTVETFWRIYRSRERFDAEGNFGAWAYRIATNLALSHVRRARREEELPEEVVQSESPDTAVQGEMVDQVRRAFERLPAKLQVTVTMALVEEQPYPEIAKALGVPVGTVKSRVFRAVRILRKQLKRLRVHT
ncbi:MAG TPA: sigma-70 family RNA polymerase sigma factor [Candidatus Angelobacter sp.]|nr:sigma-70 family RNA polymerase sigma factor [Candidatus Angelobacter sp.]